MLSQELDHLLIGEDLAHCNTFRLFLFYRLACFFLGLFLSAGLARPFR